MFTRYAVYFTPDGRLADFGASWLGWDLRTARNVRHPEIPGIDLEAVTRAPRKYGFHGTIKPPFALAEGCTEEALSSDIETLAAGAAALELDGLALAKMGRFLALTPLGDQADLAQLAAMVVQSLDHYRAPLSQTELDRRRAKNLSAAQEQHLLTWGYPYVLDQFRFHITLTGSLPQDARASARRALENCLEAVLPSPFKIDALSLVGEREDGRFQVVKRFPLAS